MVAEKEFLLFVATLFGVPSEALSLATSYGSLPQWDSAMHIRLVMELQEKYGLELPLDAIPNMRTLADFYTRLVGHDERRTGPWNRR